MRFCYTASSKGEKFLQNSSQSHLLMICCFKRNPLLKERAEHGETHQLSCHFFQPLTSSCAEGSRLLTSNLSNKRCFQSFELNSTMTLLLILNWTNIPGVITSLKCHLIWQASLTKWFTAPGNPINTGQKHLVISHYSLQDIFAYTYK